MEGEQTGCVIQRNVRNEAVQVHVNEELEVRTCSRTNLGIFHVKFGRHVHVNEGLVNLVVWTLSRADLGIFYLKFGTCKRGNIVVRTWSRTDLGI